MSYKYIFSNNLKITNCTKCPFYIIDFDITGMDISDGSMKCELTGVEYEITANLHWRSRNIEELFKQCPLIEVGEGEE